MVGVLRRALSSKQATPSVVVSAVFVRHKAAVFCTKRERGLLFVASKVRGAVHRGRPQRLKYHVLSVSDQLNELWRSSCFIPALFLRVVGGRGRGGTASK